MYTIEWTQEMIVSRRYEDTVENFVNKTLYHVKLSKSALTFYVKSKVSEGLLELVATYNGEEIKPIVDNYLYDREGTTSFEVPDIPENLKADLIRLLKHLP